MKNNILFLSLAFFVAFPLAAEPSLDDPMARYSYTMGIRLGELLQGQGVVDIDVESFAAGIDDVMQAKPPRLSVEQMLAAVAEQRRVVAEQREQVARENLQAGEAFLRRNAERDDVTVLPSGLQYRVIARGDGEQPGADDTVRVHYHGTLIDGTVFDSSVERGEPAEFPLAMVVPGFREALANMHVGDHWQVFLPSELAYGAKGAGGDIGPNTALIFDLQLLDIVR